MEDLIPSDQLIVNPGLAMREAAAIGVVCRDAASGSKASLIAPIFSVSGALNSLLCFKSVAAFKDGKLWKKCH